MHTNSLNAYHNLNLTKRQQEVYTAYATLGEATDQQVADYLGYAINRITGRVRELACKGVVIECDTVMGDMGKLVRVCRIKDIQTTLFEV